MLQTFEQLVDKLLRVTWPRKLCIRYYTRNRNSFTFGKITNALGSQERSGSEDILQEILLDWNCILIFSKLPSIFLYIPYHLFIIWFRILALDVCKVCGKDAACEKATAMSRDSLPQSCHLVFPRSDAQWGMAVRKRDNRQQTNNISLIYDLLTVFLRNRTKGPETQIEDKT